MNLVMQPDFLVLHKVVAIQLDTVHSQVGPGYSGRSRAFGIHLWQCHVATAIHGPRHKAGQPRDGCLPLHHRTGRNPFGQCMPGSSWRTKVLPWTLERIHGAELELHQALDRFHCIAKNILHALSGAVNVGSHGKAASLHVVEQQGRTTGMKDPSLNSTNFYVGVDSLIDLNQVTFSLKCFEAFTCISVSHFGSLCVYGDPI